MPFLNSSTGSLSLRPRPSSQRTKGRIRPSFSLFLNLEQDLSKRVTTQENDPESSSPDHMPEQDAVVADLAALEGELDRMAKERESLHGQLLRTMADMQNYKRRVEQDRAQTQLRASEGLLKELLPILDSFDRTVASIESGASPVSMVEGIKSVEKQLRTVLEGRKLKRIPTVGQIFDPVLHEAILVDAESDQPEGTIVEELDAGYTLADQVLRPARVKVSKGTL